MDYYSAHVWNRRITAAKDVRCFGGCGDAIRAFLLTTVATNKREEQARRDLRFRFPSPQQRRRRRRRRRRIRQFCMRFLWNCFPHGEPGGGVFFLEGDRSSSVWRLWWELRKWRSDTLSRRRCWRCGLLLVFVPCCCWTLLANRL